MDWKSLHFGKISPSEVAQYVADDEWQALRLYLKGKSLEEKYRRLSNWLHQHNRSKASQVQVTNYVTALSRGGLIKPSDYTGAYDKPKNKEDK